MDYTSLRKAASNALMIILSLVIVFHFFVLSGVIPFSLVWGGRLKTFEEMVVFELVSISLNVVMVIIAAIHAGKLSINISPMFIQVALWLMSILFFLNTIGNLMSVSETEKIIFTPLTALLCILTVMLASGKRIIPVKKTI